MVRLLGTEYHVLDEVILITTADLGVRLILTAAVAMPSPVVAAFNLNVISRFRIGGRFMAL